MSRREYHLHGDTGEVVQGPAARCIDSNEYVVDVLVTPIALCVHCGDTDHPGPC